MRDRLHPISDRAREFDFPFSRVTGPEIRIRAEVLKDERIRSVADRERQFAVNSLHGPNRPR
jgi:hypothetical protein